MIAWLRDYNNWRDLGFPFEWCSYSCMYVPGFGDNLILKSKLTSFKPNSLWFQQKKKKVNKLA